MEAPVLEIRNLSVTAGRKRIVKGLDLTVGAGEVHVLMGPNGSGKTTILMAVMGMPGYEVTEGVVRYRGRDVTSSGPDERCRAGIAMAFQKPPQVHGVSLGALAGRILASRGGDEGGLTGLAGSLRMSPFLHRDLNVGLSGGEVKRSELLQLLVLEPELSLFDEPDSGVDLDSIAVVGETMREILGCGREGARSAGLIVTHTGHILSCVPADRGHVLMEGRIVCEGNPQVLFDDVRRHGFKGCLTCRHCRSG